VLELRSSGCDGHEMPKPSPQNAKKDMNKEGKKVEQKIESKTVYVKVIRTARGDVGLKRSTAASPIKPVEAKGTSLPRALALDRFRS